MKDAFTSVIVKNGSIVSIMDSTFAPVERTNIKPCRICHNYSSSAVVTTGYSSFSALFTRLTLACAPGVDSENVDELTTESLQQVLTVQGLLYEFIKVKMSLHLHPLSPSSLFF